MSEQLLSMYYAELQTKLLVARRIIKSLQDKAVSHDDEIRRETAIVLQGRITRLMATLEYLRFTHADHRYVPDDYALEIIDKALEAENTP